MAAAAGKLILIEMENSATPAAFVPVGGLRTQSITYNSEIIDVTNADSPELFREVLPGVGVKSFTVSGSGIADSGAGFALIEATARDQSHRDTRITVPGFGSYTGEFRVTTFEITGEYNGAVTFSTTLESSGAVAFTAA
jgi:TP901-1 family phage major tail protein